MNKGQIVVLNGTSSSGKTSIAGSLKQTTNNPCAYVSYDEFVNMYGESWAHYISERSGAVADDLLIQAESLILPGILTFMNRTIAAFSILGYTVIVDVVIGDLEYLRGLLLALNEFPVYFVGVHCPLDVLEQREHIRGDRAVGLAKEQIKVVHEHVIYDLNLDTSSLTPTDCARSVKNVLESDVPPTAYQSMVKRYT